MMIFIAVIFFILLIIGHEYGHFIAAKLNGVEVEEFGIGFPPKLVGKVFGRGIWRNYYTFNLLPLGGFVRLKGEADADKGKGTFGATSFWVKTKIILAGVFMNLLIAWVIFTGLAISGIPTMIDGQFEMAGAREVKNFVAVGFVSESSPAEQAGLEVGDTISSINGLPIEHSDNLFSTTKDLAGQSVVINYVRKGLDASVTTTLNSVESDKPFLGVGPANIDVKSYPLWKAPIVGVGTTLQLAKATYVGLGDMVANVVGGNFSTAADNVSGPVGIFVILNNASIFGFEFLLFFIGIISLTLAVMNSLPIPALDGGRLFVSGLFKLFKKPLSKNVETAIHGTGFALLMGLIVLISVLDVQRFF